MKPLHQIKALAEQMLALAAELLCLLDHDETERRALIEDAKKTPAGM